MKNWELFVKSMSDRGLKFLITGLDSSMLRKHHTLILILILCSSLTIYGIFISMLRLRSTVKSGSYPSVTIALPGYLRHSRSCTSPPVVPARGNVRIRTWIHYILWSHRQQFPDKNININQLKMAEFYHEI